MPSVPSDEEDEGSFISGFPAVLVVLPLPVYLEGFFLQASGQIFTELHLLLQVLELLAGIPVYAHRLDMLVRLELLHALRPLAVKRKVELAQLAQVYLVAFGHFLGQRMGDGGDDGLVVAGPIAGTVEHDVVYQLLHGQGLFILRAGIRLLAPLWVAWMSTHHECVFHLLFSFLDGSLR